MPSGAAAFLFVDCGRYRTGGGQNGQTRVGPPTQAAQIPALRLADFTDGCHLHGGVRGTVIAGAMLFCAAATSARSAAPLYDPVSLNIGLNCQWQQRCIREQTKAMRHALKYVKNKRPPSWRIQACNKNASRRSLRVDWIGFNNCIRNASVPPVPQRPIRKRTRPLTESTPRSSPARGERGQ